MPAGPYTADSAEFANRHSAEIAEIYSRGDGGAFALAPELLAAALMRGARSLADAGPGAVRRYLGVVNATDLVLACACSAGIAAAWEKFIAEYRPILRAAARAIVRDDVVAGELADSLWADLYGLGTRNGERGSILDYFHGRSSLATWLRAVAARRHIDSIRANRANVQIDTVAPDRLPHDAGPRDPDRARLLAILNDAIAAALAALEPRDAMRLRFHYGNSMTLQEIGRIFGEREWTVSRRLKHSRRLIKTRVDATLRGAGLDSAAIGQCYAQALEDWPFAIAALNEAGPDDRTRQVAASRPFKL